MMETLNLTLVIILTGLAGALYLKVCRLEKRIHDHIAWVSDLNFKFSEMSEFMDNHIAKVHYDLLKRTSDLLFREDTQLDEALSYPEVRDILVKSKLIQNNDTGPFQTSLEQRAKERKVPLASVLIALNDLKIAK